MTSQQLLHQAIEGARKAIGFALVADSCLLIALLLLWMGKSSVLAAGFVVAALLFLIGAAQKTAEEIALTRHAGVLLQSENLAFNERRNF